MIRINGSSLYLAFDNELADTQNSSPTNQTILTPPVSFFTNYFVHTPPRVIIRI